MGSLIKIGIIGNKTEDIMLYLSRILLKLEKKVAIFDSSYDQFLKDNIPQIEKVDVINYRNIDIYPFCNSVDAYCKMEWMKYDIVLINYGYNVELISDVFARITCGCFYQIA